MTILQDESYFYSHKWTLGKFLKQKNGAPEFMDDGERWISYIANSRGSPKKDDSTRGPTSNDFDFSGL